MTRLNVGRLLTERSEGTPLDVTIGEHAVTIYYRPVAANTEYRARVDEGLHKERLRRLREYPDPAELEALMDSDSKIDKIKLDRALDVPRGVRQQIEREQMNGTILVSWSPEHFEDLPATDEDGRYHFENGAKLLQVDEIYTALVSAATTEGRLEKIIKEALEKKSSDTSSSTPGGADSSKRLPNAPKTRTKSTGTRKSKPRK